MPEVRIIRMSGKWNERSDSQAIMKRIVGRKRKKERGSKEFGQERCKSGLMIGEWLRRGDRSGAG